MDTRMQTAKRWQEQAHRYAGGEDWFSAYVAGYIALAICSLFEYSQSGGSPGQVPDEDSREREAIKETMKGHRKVLAEALVAPDGVRATTALRQREVPGSPGLLMIGPRREADSELGAAAKLLYDAWSPLSPMSLSDDAVLKGHADALALLLRKVRNGLFHGEKNYDPYGHDLDLLRCLVPVLRVVVDTLMGAIDRH